MQFAKYFKAKKMFEIKSQKTLKTRVFPQVLRSSRQTKTSESARIVAKHILPNTLTTYGWRIPHTKVNTMTVFQYHSGIEEYSLCHLIMLSPVRKQMLQHCEMH